MSGENPPPDTLVAAIVEKARYVNTHTPATAPTLTHQPSSTTIYPTPSPLPLFFLATRSFDPREILEIKDDYSRCALHYAAMYATSVGVVELLIDKDEQVRRSEDEAKTLSMPVVIDGGHSATRDHRC